jgi:poly-gamma-glutamate synthase PgsB/CapB
MYGLFFALSGFCCLLARYVHESREIARSVAGVATRIGVTGTRGKSGVTRLIAAAMRGAGRVVVAKTTGSRPMLIYPDGSEAPIHRHGSTTILEQKKLLALARTESAEAFVSEIMSVNTECQEVESRDILRINICVITNVRIDHVSEQGNKKSDVARALSRSIPARGIVVCGEGEDLPEIRQAALEKDARLIVAPRLSSAIPREPLPRLGYTEFEENISLALAVCGLLGIDGELALRSMESVVPDLGALREWRWKDAEGGGMIRFINAFAANDPESSLKAIDRALVDTEEDIPVVGVLSLREDRGERTVQWLETFADGLPERFSSLYAIGAHARIVERRLRKRGCRCSALRTTDAASIVTSICRENPGDVCLVGFGNIVGLGAEILAYCEGRGDRHE